MKTTTADVTVIGGGSSGTAIAWQLADRGAGKVVLLDKGGLATGTTAHSCAIVRTHYMHETLSRLALHCRTVFEQFAEIVGGDAEFRRSGWLSIMGEADREALAENVAMHRAVGIDARVLTPEELTELVPGIAVDDIGIAAYEPDSGYANSYRVTLAFAEAAQRHGAKIRTDVAVTGIEATPAGTHLIKTPDGAVESHTVVVAAGYHTRALLQPLGVDLPITPVRHTVAVVQLPPPRLPSFPIISDRDVGSYYRPAGEDEALVGSTGPFDGDIDSDVEEDRRPATDTLHALSERLARRFPAAAPPVVRSGYTSIYDCSPDSQPLLGPVEGHDGLYVAVGMTGHGFKLSPAIGQLIADDILDVESDLADIELFSPGRFVEGRHIEPERTYSVPTLG